MLPLCVPAPGLRSGARLPHQHPACQQTFYLPHPASEATLLVATWTGRKVGRVELRARCSLLSKRGPERRAHTPPGRSRTWPQEALASVSQEHRQSLLAAHLRASFRLLFTAAYYSTDGESEAQRGVVTCQRPQS